MVCLSYQADRRIAPPHPDIRNDRTLRRSDIHHLALNLVELMSGTSCALTVREIGVTMRQRKPSARARVAGVGQA